MNTQPLKRPKVKAMAVIGRTHQGREQVLGYMSFDRTKNQNFYRLVGGHVEMGETSRAALIREIREELGVEVDIGTFFGWSENIFTYEGETGHEVIALYDVTFKDAADIRDEYTITDTDHKTGAPTTFTASWANIEDVKAGATMLYPLTAIKHL